MTNLSSLSKAIGAIAGLVVIVILAAILRFFVDGQIGNWIATVEIVVVVALAALSLRWLRRTQIGVKDALNVCQNAFHGNLEARIQAPRDGGELVLR